MARNVSKIVIQKNYSLHCRLQNLICMNTPCIFSEVREAKKITIEVSLSDEKRCLEAYCA
jgi:hypothetical protein